MIAALTRGADRLLDASNLVARAMAYLSGLNFMVVSVYIALDVIGRRFFHVSSAVTDEMGGYALVFGSTAALAFAMSTGSHVRIDILLPKFPRRMQAILNYTAYALMTLFAAMLAYYSWKLAVESWQTDARAMSFLRTPIYIPQSLMSFGFTVLTIQTALMLALALLESLSHRRLEGVRIVQMTDLTEGL